MKKRGDGKGREKRARGREGREERGLEGKQK